MGPQYARAGEEVVVRTWIWVFTRDISSQKDYELNREAGDENASQVAGAE